MAEPRLQGWDHIAPVLGWTVRTAIRHRQELREHKAIFYQWLGKPPRKTVCSYESLLRLFLVTREDSAANATDNSLLFQAFHDGREYRIHVDGTVRGFKEIVDAPPSLRDDPDVKDAVIIFNHYPDLLDRAVARALSRKLTSPTRKHSDSGEGGSSLGSGGSQGTAENNRDKMSACTEDSE